jgi:Uma2 family endonuclease
MGLLTIELPAQEGQRTFNLRRWAMLSVDPELARIPGRIETDRHGHIIMSPPPTPSHGSFQIRIGHLLTGFMPRGRVLSECPISTADGVKAADVAWASPQRMRDLGNRACFPQAPELCVEILSPGNTEAEIAEKIALYFDAGAREVWICTASGAMKFFSAETALPLKTSRLCPKFPKRVELP